MARGGVNDVVLDDPALKLDGHPSDFAARVAVEHSTVATGHARGAYVSVPTRPGRHSWAVPWPGWVVGVRNLMAQP